METVILSGRLSDNVGRVPVWVSTIFLFSKLLEFANNKPSLQGEL